jgi:nicotinate-nucleotide pyrophosphorylase (carboxylating)
VETAAELETRAELAERVDRSYLQELVRLALREDVGSGDVTTRAAVPPGRRAQAEVVAKAAGMVAGTAALVEVYRQVDSEVRVEVGAPDGSRVERGAVIATVSGDARSILTGERVALNLLGRFSGVATLTRRFVDAVAGTGVQILDTRKTTPGYRALERTAVRAGGGTNHRFGLDDAVLVKTNHVRAAGSVERALEAVREGKRLGLFTEVEVTGLEELAAVLEARPDRVLLDNLSVPTIREAVRRIRAAEPPRIEIEVSGGVMLESAAEIARAGVDFISVGALTHSAPCLDVALRIRAVT